MILIYFCCLKFFWFFNIINFIAILKFFRFKYIDKDTTYQKIDFNPLSSVSTEINNSLENLLKNGHISTQVFSQIKIREIDCKLGSFHLFAKLHKKTFSWRPINNFFKFVKILMPIFCSYLFKFLIQKCNSWIFYSYDINLVCFFIQNVWY